MCSVYASLAPEFYLHHSFLDKLWYTWQQHSKACLYASFSKANRKMLKFKCHHSPREMIDSSRLPGNVNVTYTDYIYGKNKKTEQHDIEEQNVVEESLRKESDENETFRDMLDNRELSDDDSGYDRKENRRLVDESSDELGQEFYRRSDETSDMEGDDGTKIVGESSNELGWESYRGSKEITDVIISKDRLVIGTPSDELGDQSYEDFGDASSSEELTKMRYNLPHYAEPDGDQISTNEDENLESEGSYPERYNEGKADCNEDSHWPPYKKFSFEDVIRRLSS